MKKILLIEDNKNISDNIKSYLELEDIIVDRSLNWEEWFDMALSKNYDMILLDIMLPWMDGFRIAEKLWRKTDIPIIIISAKEMIDDKLKWFNLWVIDYIVKPFDLRELYARMKTVLNSSNWNQFYEIWDMQFDFEKRIFKKSSKNIKLTQKEYLIMDLLFKNISKPTTRTDIIEYVWWSDSLFDSDAKLDVYISWLRTKFWKSLIETIKWVWYKINN